MEMWTGVHVYNNRILNPCMLYQLKTFIYNHSLTHSLSTHILLLNIHEVHSAIMTLVISICVTIVVVVGCIKNFY